MGTVTVPIVLMYMGGRKMTPKYVHILLPGTCDMLGYMAKWN